MNGDPFVEDTVMGKVYDGRLVKRLLKYVKPHRRLVFLAMFFMLLATSVELLIPYITKLGIDRYLARLYQVYTSEPAVCSDLVSSDPAENDFIPVDSTTILLRKAALDGMDSALAAEISTTGQVRPETYYLFPAEDYDSRMGMVLGDNWLVPEKDLSMVPPEVLLRVRGKDLAGIARLALVLGGLILVSLIAGYGHVMTLVVAGQRAMCDVRMSLFAHIQKLSLSFYSENPVGRLVTRVTNDIEALNEMFAAVLVNSVKDLLLVVGTAAILFMMDVKLALISMAVMPVFITISVIFRTKARGAYRLVRKFLAKLNANMAEDLNGVKVVQIFGREKMRHAEYEDTNMNYFRANMRQLVVFGVFRPLIEIVASCGVALVLIYGGAGVLTGALTLGALVAFISYVRQMFHPLADLSDKYNIMQGAMASAERIFKIMDTDPEIISPDDPVSNPAITGLVEFRDVSFSYIEDQLVLRNLKFTVEPGRSVALVGPTGAGKTSIINLLCRFYDPDSGSILIDGKDLREYQVSDLRDNISIVLQDAFIFSRSVEDNIRLGRDMSRNRVMKASEMVQASGFIENLPAGYDTEMAERGATLSTGQKQLICFARALAHDPRILVLDEATSSIDPATEQLIQSAIETLMKGRTSIIVAHRLSTIQKADEILVIDGGRILERGNHQELLARRGIYYNLYLLQYREA
jgi:ATP-binding cassette subfamily B multidrug efflux pump